MSIYVEKLPRTDIESRSFCVNNEGKCDAAEDKVVAALPQLET